jgi:hypothetical protein
VGILGLLKTVKNLFARHWKPFAEGIVMRAYPYLPELLAEIAEVAGLDAALAVARAKGGVKVYFPHNPMADHWLSQTVGHSVALAICNQITAGSQGIHLDVPLGPSLSRAAKWRGMKRMRAEGKSNSEIARTYGCYYKTVQRVVNGRFKTVNLALAQQNLFLDHE